MDELEHQLWASKWKWAMIGPEVAYPLQPDSKIEKQVESLPEEWRMMQQQQQQVISYGFGARLYVGVMFGRTNANMRYTVEAGDQIT